jgi:hypothetical protein
MQFQKILLKSAMRSFIFNNFAIELFKNLDIFQTKIDALTIAPSGTEVTDARNQANTLDDRITYFSKNLGNYPIEYKDYITENTTPSMNVVILGNEYFIIDGFCVKSLAATSGLITAPSTNNRIDLVVLNKDGSTQIYTGDQAVLPLLPFYDVVTQYPLAAIHLTTATTTITNAIITNSGYIKRGVVGEIARFQEDVTPDDDWQLCNGAQITNPFSIFQYDYTPTIANHYIRIK